MGVVMDEIKVKSLKRNKYGDHVKKSGISLPLYTVAMVKAWAKEHNMTYSRAVHDLLWFGYHADKGDYKPYYHRK